VEKKLARELEEKEKLTNGIAKVGLWSLAGQAVASKRTEKVRLLKLQLNLLIQILDIQFTVDQLQSNLYHLLPTLDDTTDNVTTEDEITENKTPLSLDYILTHPESLVGQKVNDRFEVDGDLIWYSGSVRHFDRQTEEFLIVYDGHMFFSAARRH